MKTAVYPGSFDPITKGHLDVLDKATKIFDKVIIAVLNNCAKQGFIPIEDRVSLIEKSLGEIKNVEVASFDGLTVEYAKKVGANHLIRGLRAVSDFEYEMQISQTNQCLANDIDTVFLITKPNYNFISSGTVKEIALMGGDVSKFVPEAVVEYLKNKIKER